MPKSTASLANCKRPFYKEVLGVARGTAVEDESVNEPTKSTSDWAELVQVVRHDELCKSGFADDIASALLLGWDASHDLLKIDPPGDGTWRAPHPIVLHDLKLAGTGLTPILSANMTFFDFLENLPGVGDFGGIDPHVTQPASRAIVGIEGVATKDVDDVPGRAAVAPLW